MDQTITVRHRAAAVSLSGVRSEILLLGAGLALAEKAGNKSATGKRRRHNPAHEPAAAAWTAGSMVFRPKALSGSSIYYGKISQSRARRAPRIAPVTNPIPKAVSVVVKGFPEIVLRASSTSCPPLSAASLPSSITRSVTEFCEADLLGSTIGRLAPAPLEEGFCGAPKGS
jgi:hypothetical protein